MFFLLQEGYWRFFFDSGSRPFVVFSMDMQLWKIFVHFLSLSLCLSVVLSIEYKVTIKTGRGLLAGTDAAFCLTTNDCKGVIDVFDINGCGSKLERNSEDVFTFEGSKHHWNIDHITVQRMSSYGLLDGWYLGWIRIEVEGSVYYSIVNKWLQDNAPHKYQLLSVVSKEKKE